ncbi:acetoin utilization AcuB family protein [Metabacillus sp. KIGAM252]|uniref:Acetoin utilization AcuB family protein n=1 Tax=Metabacillus flavus TaxID=2823519 RepID=A0ABS5LH21_9BACI|nr:acetoin utilization AcuB family protein [Metabacillus flavus]MBS2970045.1 acetoin utilization AcuB family protein [Metabacillus flavus]
MIVDQIMNRKVITLNPGDTLAKAIDVMKKERIRHIPIVNGNGSLAGIVSDRDVKDAAPSVFQLIEKVDELDQPLENIMKTDVVTGHPLDFVEEISSIFYERKIGCMPILKAGKLAGIITESDLLHTFVQLTGANQPGSQIEVKVPNRAGMLSEVSGIFQQRNINIASVLVYPDRDDHFKILVFRVQTMNPTGIISDLEAAGYPVLWPNMPGMPL